MSNYIGIKLVKAEPMTFGQFEDLNERVVLAEKSDIKGYIVTYSNGYSSWCPKEAFEDANFAIDGENKLSINDINNFIESYEDMKIGTKTTLVKARLVNGFEIIENSSCVCPENYDHEIGVESCKKRIEDKVWMLLGFMLQTALNGVNSQKEG